MKIQRNVANFMRRNGPNVMGYNKTLLCTNRFNGIIAYTHDQPQIQSATFFKVQNDELIVQEGFIPPELDFITESVQIAIEAYEKKITPKVPVTIKGIKQHDKYNATLYLGNNYYVDITQLPFLHRALSVNTWKTVSAVYILPTAKVPMLNFSFVGGKLQFFLPISCGREDAFFATD